MCDNTLPQCEHGAGATRRSSAGRRRRSKATSFLTAAALHLVLPSSTDAFIVPVPSSGVSMPTGTSRAEESSSSTRRRLHVGPSRSRQSTFTPLRMSASSMLDGGHIVSHRRTFADDLCAYSTPSVGSTLLPSTAFLSSNSNALSIPGTVSKYGGRASGSVAAGVDDDLLVSSRNTLGFVIVDDRPEKQQARTGTSLGLSRSTQGPSSDQVDGASFLDGHEQIGGGSNADGGRRGGRIRTIDDSDDSTSAGPVTRRVASSLLRSTSAGGSVQDDGTRADAAASPSCVVPAWFPWIPTRSQIEMLKMTELRNACVERGLSEVRKGQPEFYNYFMNFPCMYISNAMSICIFSMFSFSSNRTGAKESFGNDSWDGRPTSIVVVWKIVDLARPAASSGGVVH